eukprot:1379701-Amorphochlora_amoeboformis.AAC.1
MQYCALPHNMLKHYYRKGVALDCGKPWQDFKFCFRVKMAGMRDYKKAKEMLEEYNNQGDNSHPVFPPRSSPPRPWGDNTPQA